MNPTQPGTHPKKILVVEDDQLLSSILGKQLEDKGYIVKIAGDGVEGLAAFFAEKPDGMILDIMMPKMDGSQVLQEIHKRDPNNTTPIVVLSNSNDIDRIANALSHKAIAYLVKADNELSEVISVLEKKLTA